MTAALLICAAAAGCSPGAADADRYAAGAPVAPEAATAPSQPAQVIRRVNVPAAVAMIKASPDGGALQVLDVRQLTEYEEGHVDGATLLLPSLEDAALVQAVAHLDRQRPCLLYCVAGARAGSMAQRLAALGFRDLAVLHGGYRDLEAGGVRVEAPPVRLPEAADQP